MAGLVIVMEELFLLRKPALEMSFNIFTTQLPFLVGGFYFSAVCGVLIHSSSGTFVSLQGRHY